MRHLCVGQKKPAKYGCDEAACAFKFHDPLFTAGAGWQGALVHVALNNWNCKVNVRRMAKDGRPLPRSFPSPASAVVSWLRTSSSHTSSVLESVLLTPGRQTGSDGTDEDVWKVESKRCFYHQDHHDQQAASAVNVPPPPASFSYFLTPLRGPLALLNTGIDRSIWEGWKEMVVDETRDEGHQCPPLSLFSSAGRSGLPPRASGPS